MKPTYTTNSPISFPYPSITFNNSNLAVLRITSEGRMIIGEGLSTDEATQVAAKMLVDAFEQEIQKMVDARVAADTARLDWLQNSISLHVNSIALRGDIRDAIDTAMKGGIK